MAIDTANLQALQEQINQLQAQMAQAQQTAPATSGNVLADLGEAFTDFRKEQWFPHSLVVRSVDGDAVSYSLLGKLLSHLGIPDAILVSMPMGQAFNTVLQKYDVAPHILEQVQRFEHLIGFDRALSMLQDAVGGGVAQGTAPDKQASPTPPRPAPQLPVVPPPLPSPVATPDNAPENTSETAPQEPINSEGTFTPSLPPQADVDPIADEGEPS